MLPMNKFNDQLQHGVLEVTKGQVHTTKYWIQIKKPLPTCNDVDISSYECSVFYEGFTHLL